MHLTVFLYRTEGYIFISYRSISMMLSKGCQRHYSFLEPLKLTDTTKQSISGTLSPETIVTTTSGYSTGGSTVSRKINPSLKEHKMKSKSKK